MNKQIFSNRWFIWALVIIVFIGFRLWGLVEYGIITMDQDVLKNTLVFGRAPKTAEVDISDWKTYRNEEYGFEFSYPSDWNINVKENDLRFGSLISFEFTTGQIGDKWHGFVSCFSGGTSTIDPFYHGDFRSSEPIVVSDVATSIYREQNRGMETLQFYIPIMKRGLDVKFLKTSPPSDTSCGIFFQGFTDLTKVKESIITSLNLTDGFDAFIESVIQQFEANPPSKG